MVSESNDVHGNAAGPGTPHVAGELPDPLAKVGSGGMQ